jgi:hypothetical protein
MAKEGLFQGLPMWAKGVVAIAVVGGIGIVGYTIYKKLQKIGDKGKDDTAKETAKLAAQDYENLVKQGQKLSFPPSAYAAAAEAIVKFLDGCETLGTEFSAIEEVIKVVKKPVDWFYLIKIFGQKDISDCGTWGTIKTRYSLVGLLKDQLDSYVIVTPYPKTVLGGWTVPSGSYGDSIDVLSKYLKTVGVTTF